MKGRALEGMLHGRRAALIVATVGSFLFACFLAAAPAWHQHFHADASQPQHECAITIVESGAEAHDAVPVLTAPRSASPFATIPALHPVWVAASFSTARIFEHAPPAVS